MGMATQDSTAARRKRFLSHDNWAGISGLAAVVTILAVLASWLGPRAWQQINAFRDPLHNLSVTIDEPSTDGMDVPHCSTVKGTVKGLPPQDLLWLVIEGPNDDQNKGDFFLITALRVHGDGSWSVANVSLGDQGEKTRPFWFQVYAVDRKDTSVLTPDPNANLKSLPAGFDKPAIERPVRQGEYNIDQCGTPLST
jgi:hypothetical protein